MRFSVGLRNPESELIVAAPMFHMENDHHTFGSCMEKVVYMTTDVGTTL